MNLDRAYELLEEAWALLDEALDEVTDTTRTPLVEHLDAAAASAAHAMYATQRASETT